MIQRKCFFSKSLLHMSDLDDYEGISSLSKCLYGSQCLGTRGERVYIIVFDSYGK